MFAENAVKPVPKPTASHALQRVINRVACAGTLALCSVVLLSFYAVFVPFYLHIDALPLALLFGVLVGMFGATAVYMYHLAASKSPGLPPLASQIQTVYGSVCEYCWSQHQIQHTKMPSGNKTTPCTCKTGKRLKLPGTHHCRQCNCCIERMDHHCSL